MPEPLSEPKPTPAVPLGKGASGLFDLALTKFDEPIRPDGVGEERWVMKAGSRVGRYRLVRELGEGGFGIVWLARQLEPIQRDVAIKLIKPGMDSRRVIARFEAERQTLAMMEHRNIAAVLDAGATGQGHPYFVMELVRGEPITTYCDRCHLSIRQRLELFTQVCLGVQHAHQKAILHRDLKPSNILVDEMDGAPAPKIIDFGIAKALACDTSDHCTSMFSHSVVIGTPQYMSPEQSSNNLDVDACSDIYSLGAILFELLTGRPPFHSRDLHNVPLHKVLLVIHEREPLRPSNVILNAPHDATVGIVAANRHTDPRKLGMDLRGDLDWIILKTLEKDRSRRYESASALAADLQRYLQHEPVAARPPTRLYVMKKFVRRNRVAVMAGVFIALATLAGAGAAWWGYVGQEHAYFVQKGALYGQQKAYFGQKRAYLGQEQALERSRRLAGFFTDIVSEITRPKSNTLTNKAALNLLDYVDTRRGEQFRQDAETDISISLNLAKDYYELGKFEAAEPHFKNALERLQELGRDSSKEAADCRFWIVSTHFRHMDDETGDVKVAPLSQVSLERDGAELKRCLAYRKAKYGPTDTTLLRTQALQIELLRVEGKDAEARELLETILSKGEHSADIQRSTGLGWLLRERALLSLEHDGYEKTIADLDQARAILANDTTNTNQKNQIEADIYRLERKIAEQNGKFDDAFGAAKNEMEARKAWLGYEPPHLLNSLAELNIKLERFSDAKTELLRAVELSPKYGLPSSEERGRRLLLQNSEQLYKNVPESLSEQLKNGTVLARLLLSKADRAVLAGESNAAHLADAGNVLDNFRAITQPYPKGAVDFFAARAALAARQTRYAAAIADLERAEQADPANALYSFQTALFRAVSHDDAGYVAARERLLKLLERQIKPKPRDVVFIGRALLLRPGIGAPALEKLLGYLNRIDSQNPKPDDELDSDPNKADPDKPESKMPDEWMVALLRGMAYYRLGEFKTSEYKYASEWLASAQQSHDTAVCLQTQILFAMSQFRLGSPDAQKILDGALADFDEHFGHFAGTDSNPALHDFLSVKILKEEAEALFAKAHMPAH